MPTSYSSASSARFFGKLEERNLRRLVRLAKEEGGKAVEAYGFVVWLPRQAAGDPQQGVREEQHPGHHRVPPTNDESALATRVPLDVAADGNSRQRRSALRSKRHKDKMVELSHMAKQQERQALFKRARLALLRAMRRRQVDAMRAMLASKKPLALEDKSESAGDKRARWCDYSSDEASSDNSKQPDQTGDAKPMPAGWSSDGAGWWVKPRRRRQRAKSTAPVDVAKLEGLGWRGVAALLGGN